MAPAQASIAVPDIFIFCVSNFLSPLRRQFFGLRDGLLKPNVSNPFSQNINEYICCYIDDNDDLI